MKSSTVFAAVPPQRQVPLSDGVDAREVDDARWGRALLLQVYVLFALALLQSQVQLLAVLLVLHWAARHPDQSTAPKYTVPETSTDI